MYILLTVLPSCLICVHRFISMILISYLSLPVSLTWIAVFIYSYILPEYTWTFVYLYRYVKAPSVRGSDTTTLSPAASHLPGTSATSPVVVMWSQGKGCATWPVEKVKGMQCVCVRGFPHIIHVKYRLHY